MLVNDWTNSGLPIPKLPATNGTPNLTQEEPLITNLAITSCKLLNGDNLLSDIEFNGNIPPESVMLLVLS